jgi:hypothetical protein
MSLLVAILLLTFQDAWEKAAKNLFPVDAVKVKGRLDLRLGPSLDNSRCTYLPAKVSAELKIVPDFACGRFDGPTPPTSAGATSSTTASTCPSRAAMPP